MRRRSLLVTVVMATFWWTALQHAQTRQSAESIVRVKANTTYPVTAAGPPCHAWDGTTEILGIDCVPICVSIPHAARAVETRIFVAEATDGQFLGPCPAIRAFLDCAAVARAPGGRPGQDQVFGGIRVWDGNYTRVPQGNEDLLCYRAVQNWSDRARDVKLHVEFMPY